MGKSTYLDPVRSLSCKTKQISYIDTRQDTGELTGHISGRVNRRAHPSVCLTRPTNKHRLRPDAPGTKKR